MQYIQLQGQDPSEMNTPLSGSYNLFVDGLDGTIKIVNSEGEWYGSGGGIAEITYANLSILRDDSLLSPGTFYKITDFKTCYDQPNYDYNGLSILTGNYKEGGVSPIIVFATSSDSLAPDAYQPEWPNDNIKYDITFSQTEVTGGTAFGRIIYRKDNQGNSFDYDYREVLFKRYDAYVSDMAYGGTVSVTAIGSTSGTVTGIGTSFENFTSGQIIGVLDVNNSPIVTYYQILTINSDTSMVVTGRSISAVANKRLVNSRLLSGMSWKNNNILSNNNEYEYPTFTDIGDCFNNTSTNTAEHTKWDEETFLLPNNVFRSGSYIDNSFGADFRNNTFNDDCDSNIIRDDFYNNIIDNDFDHNTINDSFYNNIISCDFNNNTITGSFNNNHFGDYDEGDDFDYNIISTSFYQNFFTAADHFEYNLIKGSFYENIILNAFSTNTLNGFYDNTVENNFNSNQIGEQCYNNRIYSTFGQNIIGTDFSENTIYSGFYQNEIGNYFRYNVLGDPGNLSEINFYQNRIGESFDNNIVRGGFEKNQLGSWFNSNTFNGYSYSNIIGDSFTNNQNIGYDFSNNCIGNNFQNNELIGDYFLDNHIGNNFGSNSISYNFRSNQIGYQFENNTLGSTDYFNWDNTNFENLTSRNYDTFYQSLYGDEGEALGNIILGKELIMHDTVNNEYHKVKFTQWTQNGNGGGFSYERTKVWPTGEPTVYFTKRNYEDIVDVIVEGSLEIARNNNGGAIYNIASEGNWNKNQSPVGTEWNSIYTQNVNNGSPFRDNTIAGEFKGNLIIGEFLANDVKTYVGGNQFLGDVYTNEIGTYTFDNDFLGSVYSNRWQSGFYINTIGTGFYRNDIQNSFNNNIVGSNFNNNIVNTLINGTDFTPNYGNIGSISFAGMGASAAGGFGGTYLSVTGTTNNLGINASFNISVVDGIVDNVTIANEGKLYEPGDTITILGTTIGGVTGVITAFTGNVGVTGASGSYSNISAQGGEGGNAIFTVNVVNGLVEEVILTDGGSSYSVGNELTIPGSDFGGTEDLTLVVTSVYSDDVLITVSGVSVNPSVYEEYTSQIFERQGGAKRLSFYDSDDILTITNINE